MIKYDKYDWFTRLTLHLRHHHIRLLSHCSRFDSWTDAKKEKLGKEEKWAEISWFCILEFWAPDSSPTCCRKEQRQHNPGLSYILLLYHLDHHLAYQSCIYWYHKCFFCYKNFSRPPLPPPPPPPPHRLPEHPWPPPPPPPGLELRIAERAWLGLKMNFSMTFKY